VISAVTRTPVLRVTNKNTVRHWITFLQISGLNPKRSFQLLLVASRWINGAGVNCTNLLPYLSEPRPPTHDPTAVPAKTTLVTRPSSAAETPHSALTDGPHEGQQHGLHAFRDFAGAHQHEQEGLEPAETEARPRLVHRVRLIRAARHAHRGERGGMPRQGGAESSPWTVVIVTGDDGTEFRLPTANQPAIRKAQRPTVREGKREKQLLEKKSSPRGLG
jgi:hypothetical protein